MTVGKDNRKKKGKQKTQRSFLETELTKIIRKSLKATIEQALDDIFKEWK